MIKINFLFANFFLLVLLAGCASANKEITPEMIKIYQTEFISNAYEGNHYAVKSYIEKGYDINVTDEQGYTALIWSAYEGNEQTAKVLVQNNADVTIENNYGGTALYWAATRGNVEIVQTILESGNVTQEDKDLALQIAIKNHYIQVVDILILNGAQLGNNEEYK